MNADTSPSLVAQPPTQAVDAGAVNTDVAKAEAAKAEAANAKAASAAAANAQKVANAGAANTDAANAQPGTADQANAATASASGNLEGEAAGGRVSAVAFPPTGSANSNLAPSSTTSTAIGQNTGVLASSGNPPDIAANAGDVLNAASSTNGNANKGFLADNAPVVAIDSTPSIRSDPSMPRISGLGKPFLGTEDPGSTQPIGHSIESSGAVSIASAGIGTATSLITSAIASQRPTGTISGGASPTAPITKETLSGSNAIANAFSNPVTRKRNIGITVSVAVGFILIVALIFFLWWYLRRRNRQQQDKENGAPSSADGGEGEMTIGRPVNTTRQQAISNYDPSAELMGNAAGLDYGPEQPSQLDNALVNRASRLSTTRRSLLDIYGGAAPYPQDVVDGNGRPLTQQFLMPEADKFQLKGLGPISPFAPKVPETGSMSFHQRNLSTTSKLSNLPPDTNPDQPSPNADEGNPFSPTDPFSPPAHTGDEDPFSDDNMASLAPLGAAKLGAMKSQTTRRNMHPKHTDSWMSVNTTATGKPNRQPTKGANAAVARKPSRTDYTSVYMRNPFIDPPEASGPSAAPVPVPAIPKHLQQPPARSRNDQTESVTLMYSPVTANPPPPARYRNTPTQQHPRSARFLSGPGPTEDGYGGAEDDEAPELPVWRHDDAGAGPAVAFVDADGGTVRSVQTWLSGIEREAEERSRAERDNVI